MSSWCPFKQQRSFYGGADANISTYYIVNELNHILTQHSHSFLAIISKISSVKTVSGLKNKQRKKCPNRSE